MKRAQDEIISLEDLQVEIIFFATHQTKRNIEIKKNIKNFLTNIKRLSFKLSIKMSIFVSCISLYEWIKGRGHL